MNAKPEMKRAHALGILGYAALALLILVASAVPSQAQSGSENRGFDVFSGRVTFQRYCSSCHGPEAHGDGNIAQYLKIPPTNLTEMARNNGGEFPAEKVREFVDGREDVRGHGTREMPVWGEVFQSSLTEKQPTAEDGEERAGRIINQLVLYLESIQVE